MYFCCIYKIISYKTRKINMKRMKDGLYLTERTFTMKVLTIERTQSDRERHDEMKRTGRSVPRRTQAMPDEQAEPFIAKLAEVFAKMYAEGVGR